jgi:hypothetical protein
VGSERVFLDNQILPHLFNTAAINTVKKQTSVDSKNAFVHTSQAVHVSNGDNSPRMAIKVAPSLMYLRCDLKALQQFYPHPWGNKLLWIQKYFGSHNIGSTCIEWG